MTGRISRPDVPDRSAASADRHGPAIDENTVPRPRRGVVMVPVADEAVLFDERTGDVHALDSLATLMWQCFDGAATIGEIAVDVADVFSVTERAALNDLEQLTVDLAARDLLDGMGSAPASDRVDDSTDSGFLPNPPDP